MNTTPPLPRQASPAPQGESSTGRPAANAAPAGQSNRHGTFILDDGTRVTIRPVQPEDEMAFVELHRRLSDQTVRFRYAASPSLESRIAHTRLERVCHPDPAIEEVIVAERHIPEGGSELIGIGRLNRLADPRNAEISLLIIDTWQRRGLGAHLFDRLIAIATHQRMRHLSITFLPENRIMRLLCDHRGFISLDTPHGHPVRAERLLEYPTPKQETPPPSPAADAVYCCKRECP